MDILPVVKLMEQDLEAKEDIQIVEEDEGESGGANFIYSDEEDGVLPEVVSEKPTIPEEDIFVEKKKAKPVKEVKEKKPRKPMSEAQKENLKKGREKALAVRRANAVEKKEIKELTEKKKKKDIQKLRDEVSEAPAPIKLSELPPSFQSLDPEMIRKLQEDAIEGYDKKRKARKEIKKKEEETLARNFRNMNVINNATQAQYGERGFFNHLF
tara:strand:+ start:311 stop:946 length:636 start_codon:yes stop_codon:yes gene_type:complete